MVPRLKERYQKEVVPVLVKEFNYTNPNAVPRLRKIVVNIGLGEAIQNAKLLDSAAGELGQITGQKPVITRARKSIANFKLRKGRTVEFLLETLRRNPALWERLAAAELIGQEVRVTGNYSYDSQCMGGPGWVLVGDAFAFLDPDHRRLAARPLLLPQPQLRRQDEHDLQLAALRNVLIGI